jgi:hypothetical protein
MGCFRDWRHKEKTIGFRERVVMMMDPPNDENRNRKLLREVCEDEDVGFWER